MCDVARAAAPATAAATTAAAATTTTAAIASSTPVPVDSLVESMGPVCEATSRRGVRSSVTSQLRDLTYVAYAVATRTQLLATENVCPQWTPRRRAHDDGEPS